VILGVKIPKSGQSCIYLNLDLILSNHVILTDIFFQSSNSTITTCIPIEKKCDGILNFFNRTGDKFNTEDYYLRNGVVMMLGDELFCPERYISVYISIFGAAGISIILTVAIWVLTFNTIGFFGKLIAATIKKRFYSSHVPLN